MKRYKTIRLLPAAVIVALTLSSCVSDVSLKTGVRAPSAYGPVPTARQLRWHELGQYAFVHFGVDTFTDKEWGFGDEDPKLFNPTAFDANQIAAATKAGGLNGLILVAKHHDGLCLWPTKSTSHNITATSYKDGKGDIVKEMAEACQKAGLKFGVYVSPWDRNNPEYGFPGYVAVFHQQINEVTSNYGPVFEMWFDGACGGTGYYGGKGGKRAIKYNTYYDWKGIHAIIRKNQPDCIIWCGQYDEGGRTHYGDCRWGGSESGNVGDPCWNALSSTNRIQYGTGIRNGDVWCPAEGNTSIRPGWFYHASEDYKVKTPQRLMSVYLSSFGRGATFILNLPPDRRGIVHENDVSSLTLFGDHLRKTFENNLAQGASLTASNTRGNDTSYGPQKLLDNDLWSAWVTDDAVHTPEVVMALNGAKTFNMIRLREDIRLGQRIEGVKVDAFLDGVWKEIASAPNVGASRLCRVPTVTTTKVRVRITKSPVCPALSDIGLFLEPELAVWCPPVSDPKVSASLKSKAKWTVVSASYGDAKAAIDGKSVTAWNTSRKDYLHTLPQEFVVDMSEEKTLKGFSYVPHQKGSQDGVVDQYTFCVSVDGKTWTTVSEGEFGNLLANPVEQTMTFVPVKARYFKFVARHALARTYAVVSEIGVVE